MSNQGAPTNDREFVVWEHGRAQGHVEAKQYIAKVLALHKRIAELEAEVATIRAAERGRCAQICEAERVDADATGDPPDIAYNAAYEHCAETIRGGT